MTTALLSYAQAAALVAAHAATLRRQRPAVERVELDQSAGRILAQPLRSDCDQPSFARSTRDGYACRAAEASAHGLLVVAGASRAGDAPAGPLPPGTAWEIMTGAPVPAGADAVVMIEHVEAAAGAVRLTPRRTLKPGDNIVAQGAQARAGDELLAAGAAIHFGQIALAASCGYAALEVFRRPRVAILTTGDELRPVASVPAPGQIRNSNEPMLAALAAAAGGEPWVMPAAADNTCALEAALDTVLAPASGVDLLMVSGGVSAGKFDLVEPVLASLGARFHFTGVRMQPGKPAVFGELPGRAGRQTLPFFGLPGNPVSSAVTFLLFAAPLVAAVAGGQEAFPRFFQARLAPTADRHVPTGLTRFLPAFCDFSAAAGQPPLVSFVPWHGSGDLGALARSNCFLVVPGEGPSVEPGSLVSILLP